MRVNLLSNSVDVPGFGLGSLLLRSPFLGPLLVNRMFEQVEAGDGVIFGLCCEDRHNRCIDATIWESTFFSPFAPLGTWSQKNVPTGSKFWRPGTNGETLEFEPPEMVKRNHSANWSRRHHGPN